MPARRRVERRMQRHDIGLRARAPPASARARRTPGKSPSIRYGSYATTRLHDVARNMRHPLADAAEPDDAERHLARAAQRARRQVMPAAGADVVVVARRRCAARRAPARARASRLRRRRSRASWRPRRRALRRRAVSTVSKPAPMRLTMPRPGSASTTARRDRRVLQQDAGAVARAPRSPRASLLHCASFSRRPALANSVALEVDVGKIVIGEEDLGIGISRSTFEASGAASGGRTGSSGGERAPRKVTRDAAARASKGIESSRRTCRRHGGSPMTTLLRTTIAGSLPKPVVARRARGAVGRRGSSTATALAEGKRDAVRLVVARPGAGGHRHRHRRRADAPPFRHDVHRGPRRRRLRAPARRSASATATTPRCRSSSAPVARRHPIYVDDAAFLRAQTTQPVKYTLPGPMTMVDTLLRRALRQPREARVGVRRDPERGGARDRRGRRRRDPVRRAGVQRLLRRGARLGRRGARARARRAWHARPPCTSATATASRRTSTGRRRSAREWRQYEQTFPAARRLAHRPGLARMRAFARADRADRAPRRARTCWSARSTSPPTGSRRPRRSRTSSARRCGIVPADRLCPCTNCGMVPLPRDVARGKSCAALGEGAALVRRELMS